MASPRHIPAAGSGNKENISGHGGPLPQVASSAKEKKKPAGFNLRKSIAWNPAFFTEEGVLDNSELSVLTGSELMSNGSPCSSVNGTVPPLCRSGRYNYTYVLKEVAGNSCGKSSAKYHSTGNQGRRLFSSAKTPQRDERKAPALQVTQNRSSARSFQKSIPRVPAGSTQKKVPNLTSSAHMSRIPKKHLSSVPMAPRSTTPVTTVYKSNKKLAPVKTEHIHRVPELLPKSKIDSAPSMETDVVPAIHEEINSSVKSKNPQISISNFGVTSSTFAKPSALRMPSPSVGFFTQENAHISHGNAAERNVGRFSAVNTSSVVKPPRSKQPEDLKSGLHLSKLPSTNCTTATNLVSLPVTTDSNTNTSLTSEKRSLSKIISTYSAKSRDANYQERPEGYRLLAGSGATTRPLSSEKNDGAGNSMPIVYNDTSHVEGRGIIKEIQPVENSLSLKTTCFSTIEAAEDSCSLKATCSSTRPTVGSKLSPSCVSSQSNDLICQSKTDSSSIAATDLENSYVGERALAVLLSEDESCTADIDSFSCDHHNTGHATLIESMEHTLCADQMPPSGSSSDGKPAIADRNSILNDSLYGEGKSTLSDGGTELEANNASVITEDPLLHVGCENNRNYKRSNCSPVKPEAAMSCAERQHVLPVELNMEDKTVFGSDKLLAEEGASHIGKDKTVDRPRTNTILRDHLKNLVPFTEEWLAVMEACGQEVLEQKSGAVQNSPPDKTAPEPSPWSPVKRKAQDVGPFDCTKYSKSVRTSVTP